MSVLVAPSILSADFANLAADIKRAEDGKADWLHVDVMDGHFVPNLTIGAPVVKAVRRATSLPLDVHLMIENPDRYLEDYADVGSNYVTVHAEACVHLQRTLSQIRKLGMKAGVALNPATPPDCLQYVLQDIDLVLVMSVNPGFGGQTFIASTVSKIAELKAMIGSRAIRIGVDGGINPDTAGLVASAGADTLVAGSAIFKGNQEQYAANIAALRVAAARKRRRDAA